MSNHLSQGQFARCIVGQTTSAELQHIRECPECSAELEGFAKTISVFQSAVRNRIDDRIALHPSAVTPLKWVRPVEAGVSKWRWALVAAAVVVAVVLPFFIIQTSRRRLASRYPQSKCGRDYEPRQSSSVANSRARRWSHCCW